METVTAKMQVESVLKTTYSEKPTLRCSYTNNPVDNSYAKATPSGEMSLVIDNKEVHGFFQPGESYKITIEKWTN